MLGERRTCQCGREAGRHQRQSLGRLCPVIVIGGGGGEGGKGLLGERKKDMLVWKGGRAPPTAIMGSAMPGGGWFGGGRRRRGKSKGKASVSGCVCVGGGLPVNSVAQQHFAVAGTDTQKEIPAQ